MLELEAFKTLKKKPDQSLSREKKSRNYYLVAMTCLKAAQQHPQPQELYQKAADFFLKAIRYNRSDPAAYLGLAYLLMLFQKPDKALPYLQHVLERDPRNARALELKQLLADTFVSQQPQQAAEPAAQSQALPQAISSLQRTATSQAADTDTQALRAELEKELKMAERLTQGLKVTHQSQVLQRLLQLKQKLLDKYASFQQRLAQSQTSPELQSLLRAFSQHLQQLDTVLEQSSLLSHLYQQLESLLDEAELFFEDTEAQPPPYGHRHTSQLDQYFATYDTLADQLDQLEQQGMEIVSLVPIFDQLSQVLSELDSLIREA